MEPFIFGLVVAVVVVSMVVRFNNRKRRLREAWREAASGAGLTEIAGGSPRGWPFLTGRAGTRHVRFETLRTRRGHETTRVVVGGSPGISVRAETWSTSLAKKMGVRELQVGDELFDRVVHLQGRADVLRAVLDADTRDALRHLIWGLGPAKGSVLDGQVCTELEYDFVVEQPDRVSRFLTDLLDLARRLDRPDDVAPRIAANTRSEPEAQVRRQNLLMLAASYGEHPATREALKRACQDENDEVRLLAGRALKDEGRETLLEIAERESAEDACAAAAVAALGEHLPVDAALSILESALRRNRAGTAVAVAKALGATGAPAAEGPLLQVLARNLPEVSAAAAEALGRVGSAAAVLPLKEAAAREDAPSQLQRAVRQAVAEIQSRLQGASPGQVSLAEGDAGRLSLAQEDPSGRVSLTKPDPGGAR